ncbi:stromelysin-3 [Brachyhypopomus gauderio]|uniref:stromelysin-3 n=1 Tax=Brachyhypopomus gauderio TaxID=698409 RepID=UPI004042EB2D
MHAARLVSAALAFCCALCIHSLAVPDGRNRQNCKDSVAWPEKTAQHDLKKRTRLTQAQDIQEEDAKGDPPLSATPNDANDSQKRPRCGVPDYPRKIFATASFYDPGPRGGRHAGQHRHKRFVLAGGRWNKKDLTYKILHYPWQIRSEKVRQVFQEALRVWSDITPLTFTEVRSGRADINIDFTRYWHGDNLPFDGPGGILAHAFFPRSHREGDIHFDIDEVWTLGNNMGTDLLQVAAHEFGHVLGLQHSLVPGALMSPFYSFSYPLKLSEDDKKGIQYLYGPKRTRPTERPRPPHRPRKPNIMNTNEIITEPDACHTDFDAVSMIRGELFFFKSGYVWRIRDGKLQAGYPALASRHWRGIPDNIDAAFEDRAGNIWFFQGQSYWVYDAERQIAGPNSVQQLGLPVTDIQAALMWGVDNSQKVYFFKEGRYWRFNPKENRVETSHARSMADWRGIPDDIDAAFQDRYGFAHFLKGKQYWKFDSVEVRALEGYPRFIGMDFFKCSASVYK